MDHTESSLFERYERAETLLPSFKFCTIPNFEFLKLISSLLIIITFREIMDKVIPRLFIGGVGGKILEEDLFEAFTHFGKIRDF